MVVEKGWEVLIASDMKKPWTVLRTCPNDFVELYRTRGRDGKQKDLKMVKNIDIVQIISRK